VKVPIFLLTRLLGSRFFSVTVVTGLQFWRSLSNWPTLAMFSLDTMLQLKLSYLKKYLMFVSSSMETAGLKSLLPFCCATYHSAICLGTRHLTTWAGIAHSAQRLGYGLDDQGPILGRGREIFRHRIQIGSGAHPGSYSMGTMGSFPRAKRPEREAIFPLPNTSSWRGTLLSTGYVFMA
jgi:hypothetical protein